MRVHWVFLLFSLGTLGMLAGVVAVASAQRPLVVAAEPALAVLAVRWIAEYRRGGTHHLAADAVDGALLVCAGVAMRSPLTLLLLLYARVSSRALSSAPRAALAAASYAATFAAVILLTPSGPGHDDISALVYVFLGSGIPLAAAIMHLLDDTLLRLRQAGDRERALLDEMHRREISDDRRRSEANFRHLFDSNPQPMWVVDVATGAFLAVNDAAVAHYGYSREEFLAMVAGDIAVDDEAERVGDAAAQDDSAIQRRHRLKDGGSIEVEITSHALDYTGRPAAFVQVRDVTEERKLAAALRRQAFHDALTGLPNRVLLEDRATQALKRWRRRRSRPPVMLVVDLDGFKAVNDGVGHAHGDRVLATIGRRLAACVRPGDTAARLGGDEFAILLEEVSDVEEAVAVARRLVEAIQEPVVLGPRTMPVSASVGIAVCSDLTTGVAGLLSDADLAMYIAKSRGPGSHAIFTAEHRTALTEQISLQEDLTRALASGEISIVFQPQLDLASGRITAVEALARWTHPARGQVPPDVFIGLAEQTGMVAELDTFVMRTASQAVQRWAQQGAPALRLAVNISGHDLDSADLVDVVQSVLRESRLDPWKLELELTEGVALSRPETAVQRLQELRAMGIRVAIDDFGVGYSVLSRLRDMPVDRLKIDRSFVRDLCDDDDAAAIVASTIAMGHALGLTLTAEGVESGEVLDRLDEMGCDSAQGYYVCRPLPEAELLDWLLRAQDSAVLDELSASALPVG